MTVTSTPRFGLTIASSDNDPPVNRAQLNDDYSTIEALAAVAANGALGSRPPAGTRDRLYMVSSGATAGTLWWDTGSAWVQVVSTRTWRQSLTFSVPGELTVADTLIPGFFWENAAGQTSRLLAVRHVVDEGSLTLSLRRNGTAVPGMSAVGVTTTAARTAATSGQEPVLADGDLLRPVVTAVSGAPKRLTLSAIIEFSV